MQQSPQPPPGEMIITSLINDLAEVSHPFILALDDYHLVKNPLIHRLVGFLLEHQPVNMLQVILTLEDPLLPISRLRSLGQVCEIREHDLRFLPPETASFFSQVMGLDLEQEDLDTLQSRTEGWVTGLQLAALSMQGYPDPHLFIQSFAGSNRYILDYLFEEIYSRQPSDLQDFLIKTAIFDRLTPGLCDTVAGLSDSRGRLAELEKANLFIVPLDPGCEWYRYHRLFSELLRHQLRSRADISEAIFHQRACQWFESEGHLTDAIQHALAANDWDTTLRLIDQASEGMLKRGEIATLIGWFGKLPKEVTSTHPPVCMTFAWALLLASQFDAAEPLLEQAEQAAQPGSSFLGQVAAAQAYLARARGDNQRLIEKSRQSLLLLPQAEMVTRGNVALNLGLTYWHEGRLEEAEQALLDAQEISGRAGNTYALLAIQIFLARTLATRGKLRQAEAMYLKIIQVGGNIPILALAYYDLATINYEWNQLHPAGEYLQRGLEISIGSGNAEFENSGHILQVFLAMAKGEPAVALEGMERSHVLARDFSPATRTRSSACHVQLALALGDLELAEQWAGQVMDNTDAHSFYRFLGLTQPRLLIAIGQKKAATEQLNACFELSSRAGWGYALIAVRVLQTLAAETTETALDYLTDALRLAQPEGFIRTFADVGEQLTPLLLEAAKRGIKPEYVGQILSTIGKERAKANLEQLPLLESLSERELEVLYLVAAGLSNREIAEKLVISPGTAKTHIHNICGKLSVRNRTEAAMRAKELNLV